MQVSHQTIVGKRAARGWKYKQLAGDILIWMPGLSAIPAKGRKARPTLKLSRDSESKSRSLRLRPRKTASW